MVQLRGSLVQRVVVILLVILRAPLVGAYPWQARGLAVPLAGGHPMRRIPAPDLVPEPRGNPTDVAGGEGYPASRLDSVAHTQGDSMGAKSEDETGESSQGSSDALRRIMTDLDEAAQGMYFEKYCRLKIACSYEEQFLVIKLTHLLLKEMNYETLEELQEGNRWGAPASGGRVGAYSSVGEPGGDEKKTPNAADQNGFWKPCTEGIVAVLGSMLLGMVFCCVIHLWRKRRRRMAEASASQANMDRRLSDMESGMPRSNPPERWTPQPAPLAPTTPPQRPLTRPPRPPPPRPSWVSQSAQRVLQDLTGSLNEAEEPSPWPPEPVPRPRP